MKREHLARKITQRCPHIDSKRNNIRNAWAK